MSDLLRQRIQVYRPNQRHRLGWLQTWRVMIANMMASRQLIWQLFKRDFFASYKKSFLGITWIFIAPLLGIISWVLLQSTGVLRVENLDIPYVPYVLIGTTMWGLFMGFYTGAQDTLTAGKSMVLFINYPREALLVKQMAQHLANFTITLGITLVVAVIFGVWPAWQAILFPFVILPLFFFGAGLGLIGSLVSVLTVDLSKLSALVLGLLMWLTPVIYRKEDVPDGSLLETIMTWNPLTYLVCSARDIIIYGRLYESDGSVLGFWISSGLALLIFLMSWRLFFISEDRLTERMI